MIQLKVERTDQGDPEISLPGRPDLLNYLLREIFSVEEAERVRAAIQGLVEKGQGGTISNGDVYHVRLKGEVVEFENSLLGEVVDSASVEQLLALLAQWRNLLSDA